MNQTSASHFQPLIEQLPAKQAKELHFPLNMKEIKDVNVMPLDELDFKQMYHLSLMKNDLASLDDMSTDELYTQMFIRCLNFNGLSDDEMRNVLRNWIKNSADISSNDSLYIYAPVLLQYKKKNANN
uniref:Letm1 RBD domain-containing protein n=1 Tax=Panagrolaimus superbus TaxID=310955 RepID=A0A914YF12_9BILA